MNVYDLFVNSYDYYKKSNLNAQLISNNIAGLSFLTHFGIILSIVIENRIHGWYLNNNNNNTKVRSNSSTIRSRNDIRNGLQFKSKSKNSDKTTPMTTDNSNKKLNKNTKNNGKRESNHCIITKLNFHSNNDNNNAELGGKKVWVVIQHK